MRRLLILLMALLVMSSTKAQVWERKNPIVIAGDASLQYAWAGGLQGPQFSQGDFNQDGRQDLFVFDRAADLAAIYLKQSDDSYLLAVDLLDKIPPLQDWALSRDYNGDGIPDLFGQAKSIAGPVVYRGGFADDGLTFTIMKAPGNLGALSYPTSSGALVNIYTATTDIPGIIDVDLDGDLDILSFDQIGSHVVFYRNTSRENDYPLDSLHFVLEDPCWGKFAEAGLTNDIIVSSSAVDCASLRQLSRSGLHSGSTIGTFDQDRDGDVDLLLGDLSFDNLVFLANEGSADSAFIASFEPQYPPSSPARIRFFPAAFFLDLNDDGLQDLLAAPNESRSRDRSGIVFRYDGLETEEGTDFRFSGSGFLHDQMLDFGTEAAPAWIDVDGDGLQDMLVGSRHHLGAPEGIISALFYFRNAGSAEEPIFELTDSNYLNLSSVDPLGADALAPIAADMDGDGDVDLVVGNKIGKLFFIENSSNGPGFELGRIEYPWFDIDVGFSSYPCIYDVNGDSLPDLLLGEEIGNINYFENRGSSSQPEFVSDENSPPNDPSFGLIDARQGQTVFGFSAPSIAKLHDRDYLTVGSSIGNMLIYTFAPGQEPKATSGSALTELRLGKRTKAQWIDIDADGYVEMISGNSRGGLELFGTNWITDAALPTRDVISPEDLISLSPNPALDYVMLENKVGGSMEIQVLNLLGERLVTRSSISSTCMLDLRQLTAGQYAVIISANKGLVHKKLLKLE